MSAGTSFQSFSSVSYGSGGNQPHVYETSSSTQIGPNGVSRSSGLLNTTSRVIFFYNIPYYTNIK